MELTSTRPAPSNDPATRNQPEQPRPVTRWQASTTPTGSSSARSLAAACGGDDASATDATSPLPPAPTATTAAAGRDEAAAPHDAAATAAAPLGTVAHASSTGCPTSSGRRGTSPRPTASSPSTASTSELGPRWSEHARGRPGPGGRVRATSGCRATSCEIIKANNEGADYVAIAAMYQRSPFGYGWLADTDIPTAEDLVGKRIGGVQGDQIRIDAVFTVNDLPVDYEFVPMSFDPQPLVDGDVDVITCYVTNQPIQLGLQGVETESAPFSDFGLKSYGDVIFASEGVHRREPRPRGRLPRRPARRGRRQRADPEAVIPILVDEYGADTEIDEDYAEAGNPAYIALHGQRLHRGQRSARRWIPSSSRTRSGPARGGRRDRPAARGDVPRRDVARRRPRVEVSRRRMKITAVDPLELGYRKVDPPMARSFAVVRVETDAGLVGLGRGEHELGPQLPDGVLGRGARRLRRAAARHRPDRRPGPAGPAARPARRVPRLGGADQPGDRGDRDRLLGHRSVRRPSLPIHRLLGAASRPLRLYGTGHDDVRRGRRLPRPLLRRGDRARLPRVQGPPRPERGRRRRDRRRRPRPRRARRADRRGLVLVPRRPHGVARSPSALRAARRGVLRGAASRRCGSTSWPGWRPRADPDRGRRARLLRRAVRPARPVGRGQRVPARRLDLRRAAGVHGGRRHRRPAGHRRVPARRGADDHRAGRQPALGGRRRRPAGCEYDIDPYQPLVTEVGGPAIGLDDIVGGEVAPPDGPGLGVALPDDVAERFPFVPGDTYAEVFPDHEKGRSAH